MLYFVGFIVLLIVGIIGSIWKQKQRFLFWNNLASAWGYRYRMDDAYGYLNREDYPLFQSGHSKRIDHLIEGDIAGKQLCLFDFTYKTGSGKNESTHYVSGLMLETPLVGYGLRVRPENFFDRIAGFLGFEDINFEFEEFNRAFQVRCQNKKFAYDVFHTGMMEYMMNYRDMVLEWGVAGLLCYFASERQFTREDAARIKQFALGFVNRLPAYLKEMQHDG